MLVTSNISFKEYIVDFKYKIYYWFIIDFDYKIYYWFWVLLTLSIKLLLLQFHCSISLLASVTQLDGHSNWWSGGWVFNSRWV